MIIEDRRRGDRRQDPGRFRRQMSQLVAYVLVVLVFAWGQYQDGESDEAIRTESLLRAYRTCVSANEAITAANEKFDQLGALFDLSIASNPEPLPPNIAAGYAEFRQPIPLNECPPEPK